VNPRRPAGRSRPFLGFSGRGTPHGAASCTLKVQWPAPATTAVRLRSRNGLPRPAAAARGHRTTRTAKGLPHVDPACRRGDLHDRALPRVFYGVPRDARIDNLPSHGRTGPGGSRDSTEGARFRSSRRCGGRRNRRISRDDRREFQSCRPSQFRTRRPKSSDRFAFAGEAGPRVQLNAGLTRFRRFVGSQYYALNLARARSRNE